MDLNAAIEKLFDKAAEDYRRWSEASDRSEARIEEAIAEFRGSLAVDGGRKYLRIITERSHGGASCWGFIVIDKNHPKFSYGDLLKPASWKAPATNAARGNIFEDYAVRWTGPNYL